MRARTVSLMLALAALVACSDAAAPNVTQSVAGAGAGGVSTAGTVQALPSGGGGAGGSVTGLGGTPQAGTTSVGAAGAGGAAAGTGGTTTATGGQPEEDLRAAAKGLHGFRWEIACGAQVEDWSCADFSAGVQSCPASGTQFADKAVTIGGTPGQLLSVELRFRGIMEPNVYSGGTPDGDGFYVGGGGGGHRDIAAIHVSAPEQVYYVNAVASTDGPHYALEIDYVKKLETGATVHLTGGDLDCITDKNCKKGVDPCEPIVVPEVPPYPSSFDGNFVQMDLLSVTLAN